MHMCTHISSHKKGSLPHHEDTPSPLLLLKQYVPSNPSSNVWCLLLHEEEIHVIFHNPHYKIYQWWFLLIINRQLPKSHKLKLSQWDNFQFLAFFTQEVYKWGKLWFLWKSRASQRETIYLQSDTQAAYQTTVTRKCVRVYSSIHKREANLRYKWEAKLPLLI
jgi:hypothetical protein